MPPKKIMFLNRKAPYGSNHAAEMLEVVQIAAAFAQDVHLAFLDDGVFQLIKGQRPESLGQKDFTEGFQDLGDYDVDQIWVERESLAERGLGEDDLMIAATIVERAALAEMIADMDVVLSA